MKISALTQDEISELPDGSYSVSDLLEYIVKTTKECMLTFQDII